MYLTISRYLSHVFVRCLRGTRFVCFVLEETSALSTLPRILTKIQLSTLNSPTTLAFHRPLERLCLLPTRSRARAPVGFIYGSTPTLSHKNDETA